MPKTCKLRSKTMVTSDEPQAQRSQEASMTCSEASVSEVSEGQPGGTKRTIEVQHPEQDGDHRTIAASNSGTVRPAQDESRTDTTWGTALGALPHPALARVKRRL